jgi:DHA2 family multidrug resistance protein-like MFS transporter
VFLVSVPAMVVLLIAGPVLLPESRGGQAGRLKPSSVGLSLAAVLLAIYGIKQLAAGSGQLGPAVALLAGGAAGVVFVRRQLQLESPLLDLRLLRSRPLAAVLVALVFAGVAMAGTGLLVTQYLQEVLGYSPAASALLFAPMGLGVAVGTMAAPGLAGRMDQRTAIAGGLAVSALGSLLLAVAGALPMVVAGITVLAVGTGPLFALGTGLVLGSASLHVAGIVAAVIFAGLAIMTLALRPATTSPLPAPEPSSDNSKKRRSRHQAGVGERPADRRPGGPLTPAS